jgi:hypothetical protein
LEEGAGKEVRTMYIRNKISLGFVSITLLLLTSGSAHSQAVPFETFDKGEISYFRYGDPDFTGADMDIRDWRTWVWFWKKHTEGIQPAPPIPVIDFKVQMVLVVIMGHQTSGGGPSIEIVSIEDPYYYTRKPGKNFVVQVEENRDPGPLDVITNPFHIVLVRKAASVIFERQAVSNACRDDADCDKGFFCLYPEGECYGLGTCTLKAGACLMYWDPVCGCDGRTYGNACEAYHNGVSILHAGECKALNGTADSMK